MNIKKEISTALKWLFATLLVMWLLTIFYFWRNGMSPDLSIQLLPKLTTGFATSSLNFWIYLCLPYLIFLWLRYLILSFRRQNSTTFLKRLLLTSLVPLAVITGAYQIYKFADQEIDWKKALAARDFQVFNHFAKDGKFRGVHFVPARQPATEHFLPLVKNNIEWIALHTFAWQRTPTSDSLKTPPVNDAGWSKKDSSVLETANFAQKHGIRTFLQPQILIENNPKDTLLFVHFDHDSLWQKWSKDYRQFILQQAKIARQTNIELFSIGTTLPQLTRSHPDFFVQLIDSVRTIYNGKIIYTADWQTEFDDLTFWKQLDYIGIQAGFSLSDEKNPDVKNLRTAWQPYFENIKTLQKEVNLPVIFTKIGYKSTEEAAANPLQKTGGFGQMFQEISIETQRNCYLAFFETFWQEPWFAGAFFFDWRANYERAGGETGNGFSPQNKEAEKILEDWFSKAYGMQ